MPPPLVVLPARLAAMVRALHALDVPGMPAVAVIGGMAVNIRLSTVADAHRATQDIDLVAHDAVPGAFDILAHDHPARRDQSVVVDGVTIDVIVTHPVTDDDLDGLADDQRLFLAGHRWALDSAQPVRIAVGTDAAVILVPVATPAGLVAAKSHAAGYPRAARRATKHAGDLYDLFRLVEVFDSAGQLRDELSAAPGQIGRLVADVVIAEILANPARAAHQMGVASLAGLPRADRVRDVLEPFVDELRRSGERDAT